MTGAATNIFETDSEDQILTRFELFDTDMYLQDATMRARLTNYFYDFSGNIAGSLGRYVESGVAPTYRNGGYMPRPGSGTQQLSVPAEQYFNQSNNGTAPGEAMPLKWKRNKNPWQRSGSQDWRKKPFQRANFKIGQTVIDPVSHSFPPPTSGAYRAREGDTLESIAQLAYGDSSYAGMIRFANNLTDETSIVGRGLVLPEFFQTKFISSTSEPYDRLMLSIVSNLFLVMDTVQPPDDDDNVWDEIIDIVIVVVAVVISVTRGIVFLILIKILTSL